MTQTKNPHVLETESIGKLLIQYSIPAIIAMTVTSVYNIVDSIFIGHGVGPLAISGLALTFPLMNLIIAFSTLIGVGGAAISSIYLGQKDDLKATEVLHNVLILCILTGICFGGITYYFRSKYFHLTLCPRFYAGVAIGKSCFFFIYRFEQCDACNGVS